MKLRHSIFIAAAILAAAFGAAHADLTYTQGSGTTIFDFVCFTTKHCSAHANVNSAGTEIMTTSNPAQIDASTSSQLHADLTAAIGTGGNSIGSVGADPSKGPASPSSAAINVSSATTTQLVAISGSTAIYVTSFDVVAGGAGNITFVYGTGSSCGTGTTSLTGAYPLTAQAGIAKGSGVGTLLKVPAGNALCVTTSAAVQMSGSVSYMQF